MVVVVVVVAVVWLGSSVLGCCCCCCYETVAVGVEWDEMPLVPAYVCFVRDEQEILVDTVVVVVLVPPW